jgi:hypothetical protein
MNINDAYDMPTADGAAGQVMTTDGAGVVSFADPETVVITAGTNVTITGTGTVGDPYVVNAASGTCGLSIGDTYAGGIIFFLDGSGCHGLVAKATDEPGFIQWSLGSSATWANARGIYGGAQNTKKIIAINGAGNSPAADQCAGLTDEGYTDWYLPSIDELDMMYVNLHMQGLGGFANYYYWSSTEYVNNDLAVWLQDFFDGLQTNDIKFNLFYVRAVRAF